MRGDPCPVTDDRRRRDQREVDSLGHERLAEQPFLLLEFLSREAGSQIFQEGYRQILLITCSAAKG